MRKTILPFSLLLIFALVSACSNPSAKPSIIFNKPIHKIELTSRAFADGGKIPAKYTCDGENISPPLEWNNVPDNSKSFVIIMEDPDAFLIDAVHWIIYNIPGNINYLEEGVLKAKWLPNDAIHGENSFNTIGYSGPCPKLRTHKYSISIFAADTILPVNIGLKRSEIIDAVKNNIIGFGKLTGKF
jgi:Raf kinase inhibitor-like YbhB/YbcL family protein